MSKEKQTKSFYDEYWPKSIPDYTKTQRHIHSIIPQKKFVLALDAGCGTGVCSLALADKMSRVIACDVSLGSIRSARSLKDRLQKTNLSFLNASMLEFPFQNETFDFVLSWGALHHTVDPKKAFSELTRVLKKGGCIVVAVYLKTHFTFLHEAIRKLCLKHKSRFFKKVFIESVAGVVRFLELFGKKNNLRDDNINVQVQVEDWYFVPEKHFFTIQEVEDIFQGLGLECEVLYEKVGRFKSATNFIVRGTKK
jgi:2-polyprenyl-6-hydroxyphenyl methylase/3-demethylubiquinone-9 3-methyltransferase